MPLNIKDPATEKSVRELAAATGETVTTAVHRAADERRILDPAARVHVGPEDHREVQNDDEQNQQIDGQIQPAAFDSEICKRRHRPAEFRAYPGWVVAWVVRWAFLNAMRPLESCRRARWFSSFLDQRMRIPRLRFSQEWAASTTQRRARQPGVRTFSAISSPRARMCGVSW